MNRLSWKLNLPPIPDPQAMQLRKLANKIADGNSSTSKFSFDSDRSNLMSLRNIDKILTELENHNTGNISTLEWLLCLHGKDKWDQHHPRQAYGTSALIWEASTNNQWLKERLFWRLAIHYDNSTLKGLPVSMIKSFQSSYIPHDINHEFIQLVLSKESKSKASEIASYCLSVSKTPKELLEITRLPTYLKIAQESLAKIPQAFSQLTEIRPDLVTLLIRCLEQLNDAQQVEGVNHILVSVDKTVGGSQPKLVDWLRNNYGISQPDSKWVKLSHAAKTSLRKWIGATNYSDFQRLVDQVIDKINLDPTEKGRLKSRRIFWSHYSDRFDRIRILLPRSTAHALGYNFQASDISIFTQAVNEIETEVCIFDFSECFIIEFFRGRGSETRILKKDSFSQIEKKLFESDIPSPNCLRCLGGLTHDHCYCWQISCENILRQQGVKPNDGITEFKRLDRSDREKIDKYDPRLGLSYPPGGLEARKPQARQAQNKTLEMERKARQNCCGHWNSY